jgi:hypothetical protein
LGQKHFAAACNASHESLVKHSRAFQDFARLYFRRGSERLNEKGIPTPRGGSWQAVLARL